MKLRNMLRRQRNPRPARVHIRMACGATFTLTFTDPAEAFGITEQFTEPPRGFITVPGNLDDTGQLRKINRAQITFISVEAAPQPAGQAKPE